VLYRLVGALFSLCAEHSGVLQGMGHVASWAIDLAEAALISNRHAQPPAPHSQAFPQGQTGHRQEQQEEKQETQQEQEGEQDGGETDSEEAEAWYQCRRRSAALHYQCALVMAEGAAYARGRLQLLIGDTPGACHADSLDLEFIHLYYRS